MSNLAGIDLGTTFSAVAVLNDIGKAEIVPNAEGERITPSAIYFDDADSSIIRVGIEAVNSRHLNPDRSVRWIKRHIGEPDYRVNIDGKEWTPRELSSLILKKLKQDAGIENGEITDVVISVPAHFDEARRKATMDAGSLAGLNVIGIVNEPVAAALYYATTHDVSGRVLVYDLGGGTFDVTLLDVKEKNIRIICSQGDHALGGIDFDKKILEMFEQAYRGNYDSELISCREEGAKYEDEAEDVKKTLSRRDTAKKMLYGQAGSMRFEISRQQFEQAVEPLITRTDMLVEVILEEAGCKASDVNKVILAGGSTRMPLVQKRLEQKFDFAPEIAVNVDECVALGAAIQAGLTKLNDEPDKVSAGISGGLKDIKLKDVCNHSYGTICAPKDSQTGQYVIENKIILPKNTPLPCEQSQRFYTMADGQTELEVTITQGEDTDPDYINKIATEVFELPADRPAGRPIKVTYSYDTNQRMHCRFEDEESGNKLEVDFCVGENDKLTRADVEGKAQELAGFKVE
ncbi:MAG TPA: Hsp70 family protein [Planctomycetes bacterium]|nr:Hsp70 family protein [Planctomycetota bacterium]